MNLVSINTKRKKKQYKYLNGTETCDSQRDSHVTHHTRDVVVEIKISGLGESDICLLRKLSASFERLLW